MSDVHPAPPVAGIGRKLRLAREGRGLSLGDAAQALKLSQRQIEALEAEQFERLPGTAFARGFLRNYARLLRLDPEPLVVDFDALHGGATVELRQVSNAHGALPTRGRRGPSAMPAAVAAAALLGVVVAGWYFDWFRQPKPLTTVDSRAPAAVLPPVEPAAVPPAAVAAASPPVPAEGGAATQGAAPVPTATASDAVAPTAGPGAPPPAPDGLERLVFSFDQEAWVEVRDSSGEIIFSRINKAGSTQEVQGKGPFALVVGNAPSVKLSHNGQPVDLEPYTKVSVARLTLQ